VRHVFVQIQAMRRVMKEHGDGSKPLWITPFQQITTHR